MAPLQAMLVPITEAQNEYSQKLNEKLSSAGLRVESDLSHERMNKKIRNAQLKKIPYMIVIGEKEAAAGQLSVRLRSGENINNITVEKFVSTVNTLVENRSTSLWPKDD
jgi:threonyl-tRNA synthetase